MIRLFIPRIASFIVLFPCRAQEHIAFMNIPLGGPVSDFTARLADEGFVQQGENPDGVLLKGPLAGKDCTLLVRITPETQTVYRVDASFPVRGDWRSCKGDYTVLQNALTAKFGKPKRLERFEAPFREGDNCELNHLNMGLCRWLSTYSSPAGTITLSIRPVIVSNGQAAIVYEDKAGSALLTEEVAKLL